MRLAVHASEHPVKETGQRRSLLESISLEISFVAPGPIVAAQLIATKSRLRRGLFSWIALANWVFPVPVSPVSRTQTSSGAIVAI